MSDNDAKKKVKRMFASLGTPPLPQATVGSLLLRAPQAREKSDRTEQLNLRVPVSVKKRVRLLAARDNLSLSDLVLRALELYEEHHGRAPEV